MEGFRERQIATINTIESRVSGHKNWLMSKKRTRFSFEEISAMKLSNLRTRVYKTATPCDNWVKREAYYRGVGEYDYIDEDFVPIKVGEKWGGPDVSCFFKTEIEIPAEMAGKRVDLQIYLGGDSLVKINGVPYQGLDPFRNALTLSHSAKAGEKFFIEIESFCFYATPSEGAEKRVFECCALTVIDEEIDEIYWDYKVALNLLAIPNLDEYIADIIKCGIREAMPYIDMDTEDEAEFMDKLRRGKAILKEKIYDCEDFHQKGMIDLVGHSHLDIVYMWDYKEFVRKTGRTHATMLRLMDDYPEFKFCQSQAVTYKEIKENYPELYEQIKQYIKEGRWEVVGAMWVEPDCNLPSGESFVRQILEGKKFFQKEFGVTPKTVWLPDVFGNSYGMPQILAKSGIKYFVTHKPCVWNDTNQLPHHTFWWEGADGSRVFAALSSTHFVGTCEPNHVMDNWDKYKDKTVTEESLYCYGWGDGGGGVSPDMIENAKRMKHTIGMPDTRMINPEEALESIYNAAKDKELPVLKSEIYLEAHRGVPTIRTEIKKYNRRCERLYREAELYSTLAAKYGFEYPAAKLEEGWQIILTNQFHDILPGTHVKDGYDAVIKTYEKAVAIGEEIKNAAIEVLSGHIGFDDGRGKAIAVFNSLSYPVTSIVKLPKAEIEIVDEDGNAVATQIVKDLNGNEQLTFAAKDVPGVGYKVYYIKDGKISSGKCAEISDHGIENRFFKITFGDGGDIVSIFDKKNNREALKGAGNRFRVFGDNPSVHDAWDIIEEYRDYEIELPASTIEAGENGEVSASVILRKNILGSEITQKITLYDEIDRIDFETKIDWHETQKLLKVDFDLDVTTDKYTSNLAYANIERPCNSFNSFDTAKFEVCAQDFIDMSEDGFGVSILSDIKNGYSVRGSVISLSLLKAPIGPDNTADRGVNEFTYSIYPHSENWKRGETVQKFGASANVPTVVELKAPGKSQSREYIACDAPNVIIEAVKGAESGDGTVYRLVEKYGRCVNCRLCVDYNISYAEECDLMENKIGEAAFSGSELSFTIKANEIKTFKLR